jgi:cation diffusion facilitator CzcD-associated flavoprotein CzcO
VEYTSFYLIMEKDLPLLDAVEDAMNTRKSVRVQYVTDIHEYLTVTALIKDIHQEESGLVLELASGEKLRFDQLVRVGQVSSAKYDARDFTCDC